MQSDRFVAATREKRLTKIFQIGFNKCGTRTFHSFMERNGIPSTHFRRGTLATTMKANIESGFAPLNGIDRWIGYTDVHYVGKRHGVIEGATFFRELARYYPRSYFVLNLRDKEKWLKSRSRHGENEHYGERYRRAMGFSTLEATVDYWSKLWDQHLDDVTTFFSNQPYRFLSFNIERDDPQKLSDFLAPDFDTDPTFFTHVGKTDPDGSTERQDSDVGSVDVEQRQRSWQSS
nr:sulfotransferase [Ruegeria sp. ANG-S4]